MSRSTSLSGHACGLASSGRARTSDALGFGGGGRAPEMISADLRAALRTRWRPRRLARELSAAPAQRRGELRGTAG
eukprot:7456660-Alexandrium_andersonii.AAC.1